MHRRITLTLTTLLLGGLLNGCSTLRQQLGATLVPLKTEIELGEQMAVQIEKQEKIYPNRRLQNYIRAIAAPMIHHSLANRPGITYSVTVLDEPDQVNAFALPGGFIYIYTGLLLLAENEAEVAGVLAHEIGHVVGRHSANQLATQYGLAFLSNLALGENPNEIAQLSSQLIGASTQARFSRDDEREADKYGVKYMIEAAYAPHGLLSFFQKMNQLEKGRQSKMSNILSSHPPTEERIQRIEKMIRRMGSPKEKTEAARFMNRTAVLRK